MKKFLFFILVTFLSVASYSQSVVPIRADTVVIKKVGGNANIRLENSTRTLKGGVVYNVDGKGTFAFEHSRLSGDTLFVGGDTVLNIGSGGGPGPSTGDTLYVENGIYAPNDSTIRLGVNPLMENTRISGSNNFNWFFDSTYVILNKARFETAKGANATAANDLALGPDGNIFTVSGNTQINAIDTTGWQAGSTIALVFTGTPTLKHNTAGGANTAVMLLANNLDYTAAAGDYIAFQSDGVSWHETNRRIAATGGGSTGGLDDVLAVNQNLTTPRASDFSTFHWDITGSTAGGDHLIGLTNNGSNTTGFYSTVTNVGVAIWGVSTGGGWGLVGTGASGSGGIQGATVDGIGVEGSASGSGNGIQGSSVDGFAGAFKVSPASTNTVVPVASLYRSTAGGTPANGIGGSYDLKLRTVAFAETVANQIVWKWIDATDSTLTSEFSITGKNSGADLTDIILRGNGVWNAPGIANWGNFANNAAAITGGLGAGDLYRNGDVVQIVH